MAASLALLVLAIAARQRCGVWQDAFHLWSDAVAKAPGNRFARQGLAEVYERRGELERAAAEYEAAIRLDPGSAALYNQLGVVRLRLGDHGKAVEAMRTAVGLKPGDIPFALNLGAAYLVTQRYPEARDVFAAVMARDPGNFRAACALAGIMAKLGDMRAAAGYRDFALARNPAEAPSVCEEYARGMGGGPAPGGGRR
jgi:Tfp pilus assembly protein PilF